MDSVAENEGFLNPWTRAERQGNQTWKNNFKHFLNIVSKIPHKSEVYLFISNISHIYDKIIISYAEQCCLCYYTLNEKEREHDYVQIKVVKYSITLLLQLYHYKPKH